MVKQLTQKIFILRANEIYNHLYDYSHTKYVNSISKINVICKKHGIFEQTASDHLRGRIGCNKCVRDNSLLNTDNFINRANILHNYKYDYTKTIYRGMGKPIKIICKKHGAFKQTPRLHIKRKGEKCPKCNKHHNVGKSHNKITKEYFITQSNIVHNNKYDYNNIDYVNMNTHVIIICPEHGDFSQLPVKHLTAKQGCNQCANGLRSKKLTSKISQSAFIENANKIHNNRYDYSLVKYINSTTKVDIICTEHGVFNQTPSNHIRNRGCLYCARETIVKISKGETEWLDLLNIPNDKNHRQVALIPNSKSTVDGYDPKTKTVYEFNGDYWHGNPDVFDHNELNKTTNKTFGELYEQTLHKEQTLKDHGYNVITMWENDWVKSTTT